MPFLLNYVVFTWQIYEICSKSIIFATSFMIVYEEYMAYTGRFGQSYDFRREELIRKIEHSVENLTLQELEALYYDLSTKNYINE